MELPEIQALGQGASLRGGHGECVGGGAGERLGHSVHTGIWAGAVDGMWWVGGWIHGHVCGQLTDDD